MKLEKRDFDAVVVGSGPNGLAAAIYMQQNGLSVLVIEGKDTIGGGLRSAELTLPGYVHDICSAVHPLAFASPFFKTLPLSNYGLEYTFPDVAAAHPFDNGKAALLKKSVEKTSQSLGGDESGYLQLMGRVVADWQTLAPDVLGPLRFPKHPQMMASFGCKAITSATHLKKKFTTGEAKGFFAGMAAHSMLPLNKLTSSAVALVLLAAGHLGGWPIPKGGSNQIANALASLFVSLGGVIQTGFYVKSLAELPSAHAVLLDVTPRQMLQIAGQQFSSLYKWQLKRYKYGMGVFKIDWALSGPIPFKIPECRQAGTVHIGNTFDEIAFGEQQVWEGKHPEKPFVLLSQPGIVDSSRAPIGKQTAWAYCHVPGGSEKDMSFAIENQVERFAPGFKDIILAKHTMTATQMEIYNPNYIGGDINGGILNIHQLFTRPALRLSPYKTSAKGVYICSSSTPPGGGVHGMCGFHAAKKAMKDVFKR